MLTIKLYKLFRSGDRFVNWKGSNRVTHLIDTLDPSNASIRGGNMFNRIIETAFLALLFILIGITTSILGQNVYLVKDSPAVLSFKPHAGGQKNLYVFVRGDNDELYACFYEEPGYAWKWKSLGKPTRHHRVDSSPTAVSLLEPGSSGAEFARIYVRANNGHIYECEWSGEANENATWRDINQPSPNYDAIYHPSATRLDPIIGDSTLRGPGIGLVYTWVYDERVWYHDRVTWHSLGSLPGGVEVGGDPAAFAIRGWSWGYVVGANHQLYAHIMFNNNPSYGWWRALGAPPALGANGLTWWRRPALIHDPTRPGTLGGLPPVGEGPSAFVVGGGRLWELHWQAQATFWVEIGAPTNVKLYNSVSVVTYTHDFNKPYIFAIGDNGILYSCTLKQTNPREWFFHDHSKDGLPPLAEIFDRRPAAIAHKHFVGSDAKEYLYAFAVSRTNELVVCWWDKHKSKWQATSLSR